jgi:hypothetical protein
MKVEGLQSIIKLEDINFQDSPKIRKKLKELLKYCNIFTTGKYVHADMRKNKSYFLKVYPQSGHMIKPIQFPNLPRSSVLEYEGDHIEIHKSRTTYCIYFEPEEK